MFKFLKISALAFSLSVFASGYANASEHINESVSQYDIEVLINNGEPNKSVDAANTSNLVKSYINNGYTKLYDSNIVVAQQDKHNNHISIINKRGYLKSMTRQGKQVFMNPGSVDVGFIMDLTNISPDVIKVDYSLSQLVGAHNGFDQFSTDGLMIQEPNIIEKHDGLYLKIKHGESNVIYTKNAHGDDIVIIISRI